MNAAGRRPEGSLGRVVFVGAVHEAKPALAELLNSPVEVAEVVTVPRERTTRLSGYVDLEPLARAHGVHVRRCENINGAEEVKHLRQLAPDLLVVVGWTRLLGADLLAVPSRGCIGFHASLLPRYRGRAPVNWAIIRGESETGNTMMYLDVGTDTGDIVDQRRIPIRADDTCASVYTRVAEAGADMLRQHLPGLLAGTAPRRPQGDADEVALPKRTPAMGVTDWARPAHAVHDWIRAQSEPYPGAFTMWRGRKVMLWTSDEPDDAPSGAQPGEVIASDSFGLRVGTGAGSVRITAMSDPGHGPEGASEWVRHSGLVPGDRFDSVDEATSLWVLGLGPEPAAALTGGC
jgi:methionyl-tRNA formyltransferase